MPSQLLIHDSCNQHCTAVSNDSSESMRDRKRCRTETSAGEPSGTESRDAKSLRSQNRKIVKIWFAKNAKVLFDILMIFNG